MFIKYTIFIIICILINTASAAGARDFLYGCDIPSESIRGIDVETTVICLNDAVVLHETLFPDGHFILLADHTKDIAWSSLDILEHISGKDFTLVIKGFCAGKCSRLLLLMAKEVVFLKNGFAVLNDSSIKTRSNDLGYELFRKNKPLSGDGDPPELETGLPLGAVMNAHQKFRTKIQTIFIPDIKILSATRTNFTHLTWHSHRRQALLSADHVNCIPLKSLNIVLSAEYLNRNAVAVAERYKMPPKPYLIDTLTQAFGQNTVITYSYNPVPIYGCGRP